MSVFTEHVTDWIILHYGNVHLYFDWWIRYYYAVFYTIVKLIDLNVFFWKKKISSDFAMKNLKPHLHKDKWWIQWVVTKQIVAIRLATQNGLFCKPPDSLMTSQVFRVCWYLYHIILYRNWAYVRLISYTLKRDVIYGQPFDYVITAKIYNCSLLNLLLFGC